MGQYCLHGCANCHSARMSSTTQDGRPAVRNIQAKKRVEWIHQTCGTSTATAFLLYWTTSVLMSCNNDTCIQSICDLVYWTHFSDQIQQLKWTICSTAWSRYSSTNHVSCNTGIYVHSIKQGSLKDIHVTFNSIKHNRVEYRRFILCTNFSKWSRTRQMKLHQRRLSEKSFHVEFWKYIRWKILIVGATPVMHTVKNIHQHHS